MRKILALISLILFIACTPKENTATVSEPGKTPEKPLVEATQNMLLQKAESPEQIKCRQALEMVPQWKQNEKVFPKIFDFYKNYLSCMDGAIAENMSATVTESLDKSWNELKDVAALTEKDQEFKKFVIVNINSSVTGLEANVTKIIEHAQKNCPKELKSLCKEIEAAAKEALKPDTE